MEIELLCPCDGILKEAYFDINEYIISNQSIGVIQTNNNGLSVITSQYDGRIKTVLVEKGEKVAKGMILAIITI